MQNRREMLKHSATVASLLAAAGLWSKETMAADVAGFQRAAFDAKSLDEVIKALGGTAPVESKDVTITGPDIAENGAVVPLGASTTATGVKQLLLMVEKNPAVLAAIFDVSESVEPNFNVRVKMSQSSNVYAVALMQDGKAQFAKKEVKVTLGGCGG